MFSLWLIIGIAAAGAVSLTVSGVLIAVHIERRRNRRWMKENNIERSLSHRHRPHLSITDVDFNSLPRPARSLRQSFQRPRSESSRFYATCPSHEDIKTFPEGTLMDSVVDPGHIGIGKTHQWLNPSKRSRRKKKIPKLVVSGPIMTNRLSSVTELSEDVRQGTPEPVELPAHRTPRVTPEKDANTCSTKEATALAITHNHHCSIRTVVPISAERSHGNDRVSQDAVRRARSISAGSAVAPPPNVPLPELPDQPHNGERSVKSLNISVSSNVGKQQSEASTVSPTFVRDQIDQFNRTSTLSRFDFGLSEHHTRSRSNIPNLSIDTNSTSTQQFPTPQLLRPKSSGNNTPSSDFKVIDASDWNIPRGLRHLVAASPSYGKQYSPSAEPSHPISDPIKSLIAPHSPAPSPSKYSDGISRPASITSVDMFRLSVVGSPSPDPVRKGHKRQNCVKIKNLQPAEPKKRPSFQLGRLTEMEEDSMLLPSPAKKLVNGVAYEKTEASRIPNRSPPMSLRVKRPGLAASRSASGQSVKSVGHSPPSTADQAVKHANLPVPITETEIRPLQVVKSDLQLNLNKQPRIDFSPASSSFIFDMGSPQRQKSKIQGPRSLPPTSLRVRNQTGNPMGRKSSAGRRAARDARAETLRRSIVSRGNTPTVASIGFPEVDLLQNSPATSIQTSASPGHWSPEARNRRKRSNTVAGHRGEISQSNTKSLRRTDSRSKERFLQTSPAHHKSHHSPSNISIWEDVSVCGDSPDIDHRSTLSRQTQLSSRLEITPQSSPLKFRQASELIARFEGIENAHRAKRDSYRSEDENIPVRTLRDGSRKRSQTTSTHTRPHEGIGLGLRFE